MKEKRVQRIPKRRAAKTQPSRASAIGSAPDVRVEMTHLRRCMAYLAIIESVPLEEVLWIEDGKAIKVTAKEIEDWKFTGLNNRDFALMYLEGKKAQNAALCDGTVEHQPTSEARKI